MRRTSGNVSGLAPPFPQGFLPSPGDHPDDMHGRRRDRLHWHVLRQRGRVAYRTLKVQFNLDDDTLEALKDEFLYAQQVARDEDERILVWTGAATPAPSSSSTPAQTQHRRH